MHIKTKRQNRTVHCQDGENTAALRENNKTK
jgi:hypothetical protein